jgi:4-hydroxyphenylpyruvate dioxygenase-like putative hemolysin
MPSVDPLREAWMVDEQLAPAQAPPRLHHVVFAVRAESFDSATEYLECLGFRLVEHTLDDVGLRVRIDWSGGVEVVTPTADHLAEGGSVGDFLARNGEGVFSVVVRVPDADQASTSAQAAGAAERYRQRRHGSGFKLAEIEMAPLFGLPITFLETNLD